MSSKERQFQMCILPGSMIFSNQYFLSLSPILTESISVSNLSDKAQLGLWKSNFSYLEIYPFSCLCWNGRDYFDQSKYKNYFETRTLMCVSMPAVKQLNHSHNSKTRSIWPFWPIIAFINCCSEVPSLFSMLMFILGTMENRHQGTNEPFQVLAF